MSGRTGGPPDPFVMSSEGGPPPEWMPDLIPAPPLRPLTPAVEPHHDQPHLEVSADDYTNAEDQVTEQPITDEQTWTEAATRVLSDAPAAEPIARLLAESLWPEVAPLVTRAREAADEIKWWEGWSNDLTDLLPDMRDGDESQEFLIEQAIRALVTQTEDAERDANAWRDAALSAQRRIQAVRDVCAKVRVYAPDDLGANAAVASVLRALDGDDERTQG